MVKYYPIVAIVLGLLVFFTVPNQNGSTLFDAAQNGLSETLGTLAIEEHSSPEENALPKTHTEKATTTSTSPQNENQLARDSSEAGGDSIGTKVLGREETNPSIPDAESYTSLTDQGVLEWTNYYRSQNDLSPLSINMTLQTAAIMKVHDMLSKQYFEHVSPDGQDISDVVTNLGYQYITVGENLALGDFTSSKDLVDAWMASPGHRANILNKSYEQIGIALLFGSFNGRDVYLAAQEFAKPQSSCPMPSQQLKSRISIDRENVTNLSTELDELRTELEKIGHSDVSEYNDKVDQYNTLAKQINTLNADLKNFIKEYNTEVDDFNNCATGSETADASE